MELFESPVPVEAFSSQDPQIHSDQRCQQSLHLRPSCLLRSTATDLIFAITVMSKMAIYL